ncbi:S8 family serine peptidase [uncultured Jatrophihabitans sp.]|uniref:S8 family serine peptidase n=1 Tax=uncultured Jatrophihabitans sp. TaxID=1610747 RepID=UPI0035CC9A51
MSVRRWAALLGSCVLVIAGLAAPGAAPAAAAPTQLPTNVCARHVPVGHFTCFAERSPGSTRAARASGSRSPQRASIDGYPPSVLRTAYGLTAAAASTARKAPRVYVVDAYNDATAEADLAVYRRQFGMPPCTTANGCFQKLNQKGAVYPLPRVDANWAGEIALDLDMVSAICPRCDITLIEANSDDNNLLVAARTATSLGARFVSMSWGGAEDGNERSYDNTYFPAAAGVVYAAATGDGGYGDGQGDSTGAYPATSARAVAVGGTTLTVNSQTHARTAETAWSDAGSGCSGVVSAPTWQRQNARISGACDSFRAAADVSADADPDTGVALYNSYDGGWTEYGGTSAAAPMIAAAYALAGVPATSAAPAKTLYDNTNELYDPTSGSNGVCGQTRAARCQAGVGWDGPTGLGTLNGLGALTPEVDSAAHVVRVTYPGARSGQVGTPARIQVTGASYPSAALTYTARGLPPGVTISRSGLLSGTPTRAGNYAPVVVATDGHGGKSSTSFRWPVALVCSARLVSNGGFEAGAKRWTASKGIVHKLARRAHHGSHFVRLDGRGHRHTDRLTRTFAMPLGCHATLSYYLKVTTKESRSTAHDRMWLRVNGRTLQSRTNRSVGRRYKHVTLNLSRYNGKRITVSWVGRENRSRATSFYLDDISIKLKK